MKSINNIQNTRIYDLSQKKKHRIQGTHGPLYLLPIESDLETLEFYENMSQVDQADYPVS